MSVADAKAALARAYARGDEPQFMMVLVRRRDEMWSQGVVGFVFPSSSRRPCLR
jgi:hypothetical protein